MGKLDGRVAIVTAGTKGIGFAAAKRLAEDGARVVVSSRTQENVDQAVEELKKCGHEVMGVACHFGNKEERQNLLKETALEFGGIDVLIQNAGINPHPWGIMSTPDSVIDKTCNLHIKANFQILQEIQPYMAKRKHQGSIILTSTLGAYVSHEFPGIYAITKAAVISMVRAFMPELLKTNIRINCVTLGAVDTDFVANIKKVEEFRKQFMRMIPMDRLAHPDECAGLMSFLASDDASFITGENYVVAGGQYLRF